MGPSSARAPGVAPARGPAPPSSATPTPRPEADQPPATLGPDEARGVLDGAPDLLFRHVRLAVGDLDLHPFLLDVGGPVVDLPVRRPPRRCTTSWRPWRTRPMARPSPARPSRRWRRRCRRRRPAATSPPRRASTVRRAPSRACSRRCRGRARAQLLPQRARVGVELPLLSELGDPAPALLTAAHARMQYARHELAVALRDGVQEPVLEAHPRGSFAPSSTGSSVRSCAGAAAEGAPSMKARRGSISEPASVRGERSCC